MFAKNVMETLSKQYGTPESPLMIGLHFPLAQSAFLDLLLTHDARMLGGAGLFIFAMLFVQFGQVTMTLAAAVHVFLPFWVALWPYIHIFKEDIFSILSKQPLILHNVRR